MKVPFLELSRTIGIHEDELVDSFRSDLKKCHFINGGSVALFEEKFSKKIGTQFCKGTSSGTSALLAILLALDLPPGTDIIVPSFTFGATATSVLMAGYNPVFADLSCNSFLIGLREIKQAWTPNTKAVIFVNLFGEYYNTSDLRKLCDERGAHLLGDCAQSFGTQYSSDYLASAFSFFPAKNLGCLGDGGAVVTNSEEFIEKVRVVCRHGCKIKYDYKILGGNFRLDTIQASFLNVLLPYSHEWIEKRRENAIYYDKHLQDIDGITLPKLLVDHSWNQYTLRVINRDKLKVHLDASGVGNAVYYPRPLHNSKVFDFKGTLKETEKRCKEVISIPVYPGLLTEEREYIAEKIRSF